MIKEELHIFLKAETRQLLELAKSRSLYPVSENCLYITSKIENNSNENFLEVRKLRKRKNRDKKPRFLNEVVTELSHLYEDLYDLNLFIYKSSKNISLIEIQYFLKSSLDKEYHKKVGQDSPMIHSKLAIPPYVKGDKQRFNLNWELDGFKHRWKLFWWKIS